MLSACTYRNLVLEEFYLDTNDITIRRNKTDPGGKFNKHDVVSSFKTSGRHSTDYRGIHLPRQRTSLSVPWILTILRRIPFKSGNVLDHIDGDIRNNLRSNLRVTTQHLNRRNTRKRCDNTTGYTGVSFNKKAKLYFVRKTIQGVRLYRSSKTIEGALEHLRDLQALALTDGYTTRHGR